MADTTSAAVSKAMAKSEVLWLQRAAVANISKSPDISTKASPRKAAVPGFIWGRILAFLAQKGGHQFAKRALPAGNTRIMGVLRQRPWENLERRAGLRYAWPYECHPGRDGRAAGVPERPPPAPLSAGCRLHPGQGDSRQS